MVLVVFVVFVGRIIVKLALQATLRVFGLCGSFVVLVWVVLWFLVTCGFLVWSARPIVLMWFLWIGGLALDARQIARGLCGLCGLLKRFAHRLTSCYVPFRRHWRRPLQNGENDHG